MGLGGNLIWTAVFRSLNEVDGKPIRVAAKPRLSDLMLGKLHNRAISYQDDPIFRNNPRLEFTEAVRKGAVSKALDLFLAALTKPQPIKKLYERTIFRLVEWRSKHQPWHLVHVDMLIHSYAKSQLKDRFIWKEGGHAIETIHRNFTDRKTDLQCELYLEQQELDRVAELLKAESVKAGYIVVEPGTNKDWFAELRSWPMERWQRVVDLLKKDNPELQILQTGMRDTALLDGVLDFRGKTSFREAVALIKSAALFVGTEGGLMHAANAAKVPAVILWGGVTLPEFAGYGDRHRVLCHYVSCAPCGHLGWCDQDHKCMRSILEEEVFEAICDELKETEREGRQS